MIDVNDIRYRHPEVAEYGRQRRKTYNRFTLWYYLHIKEGFTLNEVGYLTRFERKTPYNHATIIHGVKTFDELVDIKDKEFYNLTKKLGMEIMPEIYINFKEALRPKLNKSGDVVNYHDQVIKDALQSMGASTDSKFDIVGKIGEETMTLDGFINLVKRLAI